MNKKFFDPVFFNYYFDYEEKVCALLEKFKINLSLFSVFMHFLKCIRSCERVPNSPTCCKVCSRVVDFHFNSRNSFRNINVTSEGTTLLGLSSDQVCNLDVFVPNADDYFRFFNIQDDFCSYFALFHYPEDIFAAFSSILIRIYVNFSLKSFNDLNLNINDERKVIDIIMTQSRFFLARFWHEVNTDFFYEFFDKFDQYNLSYCFRNSSRKPEFGPYYPAAFDTTISVIRF